VREAAMQWFTLTALVPLAATTLALPVITTDSLPATMLPESASSADLALVEYSKSPPFSRLPYIWLIDSTDIERAFTKFDANTGQDGLTTLVSSTSPGILGTSA
jgi:hypothetical protein